MKILLQLKCVPVGSHVTKKTGSVVYVVRDVLRIFEQDGKDPRTIEARTNNCRFMVPLDGEKTTIAVSGDTEVCWCVKNHKDIIDYIEDLEQA